MHERFLRAMESCWLTVATDLASTHPNTPHDALGHTARQTLEGMVFRRMCQQRGLPIPETEAADPSQYDGLLAGIGDEPWPVEALGWLHERLLGCRLTPGSGRHLRIAPHAQTKKNAGVFYTPAYVCRYIAEKSLAANHGPLPKILDPSCGCGAFLLAAFQHLRSRHVSVALKHLVSCLHGVDIDPDAVLVARRSLWLEVLTSQPPDGDLGQLANRLAAQIRVGNVLVAPEIEKSGPFDVVLGNPPYRRELHTKAFLDQIAVTDFGRRYRMPRMDLWYYFLHRSFELLKPGGRLSFIVGAYWTKGRGAEKLIATLRQNAHLEEIFSLGRLQVFPNVAGQHLILTLTKGPAANPTVVKTVRGEPRGDAEPFVRGHAPVEIFQKTPEQLYRGKAIDLEPPCDEFLARLEHFPRLAAFGLIRQGIAENPASVTPRTNQQHGNPWTVGEGVFVLTEAELARLNLPEEERSLLRPYHDLCDLGRYRLAQPPSRWLIYSTPQTCPAIDHFPGIRRHLERFRAIMDQRRETRDGRRAWWQLHWPRDERLWQAAKLLAVQMAPRPAFTPALTPAYVPFSVNVFVPGPETREHLYYLAALLNSRLLWKWFRHHAKRRGVGLEINGHVLAEAPIRPIDFARPAEVACHDRLVELVGRRMTNKTSSEATLEEQIDQLVGDLYGLTAAERRDIKLP